MKKLWTEQVNDLSFMMRNKRVGLLHDPGVGKTPPVCVMLYDLLKNKGEGTVWAMPKSLFEKNRADLLTFTPLTSDDIVIVDGTPKQRELQIAKKNKIHLVGFSRLAEDYKKFDSKHLAVDEFHLGFANTESKRGAAFAVAIRTKFDRLFIMTGSCVDGKLSTAYPIINAIEPRYYATRRNFEAVHAIFDYEGVNIVGWRNHDKLKVLLDRHCIRRTFEEQYGKANKKIMPIVKCNLKGKHLKAYTDMEQDAILMLPDGSYVDGEQEGVNLLRCRQIVACPHMFGILPDNVQTDKEDRLELALRERKLRGEKSILFGVFDPEITRTYELCKKWGLKVEYINGGVPAAERGRRAKLFEDGKLDVIIGTPGTAAVGFNWALADHVDFLSTDYKDTNFSQAYKRALRGARETMLKIWVRSYGTKVEKHVFWVLFKKSLDAHKVDNTYEVINLEN